MATKATDIQYQPMRRRDRAVQEEDWIERLLARAPVGVLATSQAGQPDVNANLFVYDSGSRCVYVHTARVGHTRDVIEANPRVAFTAFELGRLLPADTSLEFSAEFSSVVAYGECEIVDERAEATWALEAMLVKYAPHLRMGDDYRAPVPDELKRTTVLRIRVDRWAGKHKEVEADFPGAYRYEDVAAG